MKINLTMLALLACSFSITAQTPITTIDTSSSPAPSSFSYMSTDTTYNWGVGPNNSILYLNGFTANGIPYTYASNLQGIVKVRRADNAKVTGNYSLEWAQTSTTGAGKTFNMFPNYQNDMDSFLNNHIYNKGTDNIFDNTSANGNNIERLDWIIRGGYSTPLPDQVGFAVFDKGNTTTHDPFCIAVITALSDDSAMSVLSYGGTIKRVVAANYGQPGPTVFYRIVKGPSSSNLLNAGTNTQGRGGVFISLLDLGINAGTKIYGYSLFSGDLPVSATLDSLVNYTDTLNFPLHTGVSGGLDLVAVTGINIATSLVPVSFVNFNAVENNDVINLKWSVENEIPANHYDAERSTDGIHFIKINEARPSGNFSTRANSYSLVDNISSVASNVLYYRIKQYEPDGSFHYSKTIPVKRNKNGLATIIFPNPVKGTLNINIPTSSNDNAAISIFSSAGSKVIQLQQPLSSGNNSFTIDDVSKLSKGIYQLSIKLLNSGKTIIKQFTKE